MDFFAHIVHVLTKLQLQEYKVLPVPWVKDQQRFVEHQKEHFVNYVIIC